MFSIKAPTLQNPPLHLFTCCYLLIPLNNERSGAPLFQGINVIHRQPEQPPASGPRGHRSPFSICWSWGTSDCLKGHSFKASPGWRAETHPSWRELRRERMNVITAGIREPHLRCSQTLLKPPGIRLKEDLLMKK